MNRFVRRDQYQRGGGEGCAARIIACHSECEIAISVTGSLATTQLPARLYAFETSCTHKKHRPHRTITNTCAFHQETKEMKREERHAEKNIASYIKRHIITSHPKRVDGRCWKCKVRRIAGNMVGFVQFVVEGAGGRRGGQKGKRWTPAQARSAQCSPNRNVFQDIALPSVV
jgi:hypothetical protein